VNRCYTFTVSMGPRLFMLYRADLAAKAVERNIDIHTYADDSECQLHVSECSSAVLVFKLYMIIFKRLRQTALQYLEPPGEVRSSYSEYESRPPALCRSWWCLPIVRPASDHTASLSAL